MLSQTSDSPLSSETSARAVLSLVGAFLALFCSVGIANAFGVFQAYYIEHQLADRSDFDISWIGSLALGIMFANAPLVGILVDRVGATILLISGSTGLLLSVFMTSLASKYYHFILAQAVLQGLSMSFVMFPAIAIISKNFHKNRGLALGITIGGSSIGGLIWPIVLDELLNQDAVSFGWTLRIVAFIMLPLLLLSCLFVRPSQPMPSPKVQSEKPKTDLSIAKNPAFIILCTGLAVIYLGIFSPFFYVSSWASSLGMSTSLSFYMISFLNAASLFGRILPGFLADRYGHFNLCAGAALLSGIIAFCWTTTRSEAGVVVWSISYGFTSGAILSLQTACVAKIATRETQGTAVGLLMGSVALTALFGTPISGQLVGQYGYLALSMFSGATLVVGSLLITWARLRLDGKWVAAV
ncbi:mfs monocarboxylate transporter [Diplodia corticola]|uniref:Mfs monocarboxylate transporter n=1 Tax=Diplodia corticola TaxID=236234 RepID=A0A1J9QNG2_9PEZI|nr:mfs monocarboxylate transporter [Diplodia corticola]OJD30000.1 mfs monocarboxylate transporter [Diplodia corticola]